MFTSIVVGIDGSDAAERALRMACGIAKQFDAALHIVHTPRDETVAYAADAISGFYVGPNAAQQEMLREAAEKLCEQALGVAAQEGVQSVASHVGNGDPASDVLDRAEAVDAGLIVTGRRGLGNFSALVLGSTSHQISKHAKCAYLTVP